MVSLLSLTPAAVETVFESCLFQEGDDPSELVNTGGIVANAQFHRGRLEHYKLGIQDLLSELPDEFKRSCGGGMSFLNACNDKHGNQWTGLHLRMEQLFQLGIAIGKVQLLFPRDMWFALPGGMPYYVINE